MPVASGRRDKYVDLQNPVGEPVADGDGQYEQEYETVDKVFASIEPATAQKLERFTISGYAATATDIVVIPFREDVVISSRIKYKSRTLYVVGYSDPDERHMELVLLCQEIRK